MKKRISALVVAFILLGIATLYCVGSAYAWGNQSWFDTTYSFERVWIAMPDGSYRSGVCESWQDYENSDVVQVKLNGKVYLTHYMNVVLVSE